MFIHAPDKVRSSRAHRYSSPAHVFRRLMLTLLIVLLFCSVLVSNVSAYARPRTYSGYDSTPYLNVSNGLSTGEIVDVEGSFNVSSWMTTTVGKVTETKWITFELFIAFMSVWLITLLYSRIDGDMVAATLALTAITFIYINVPFIAFHGTEVTGFMFDPSIGKSASQAITMVQPWQELYLMNNGYVYIIEILAAITLFNWAICLWFMIDDMIHPKGEPVVNFREAR